MYLRVWNMCHFMMKTIIFDIDSETVKILILFLLNGYKPSSIDKQKSLFEKIEKIIRTYWNDVNCFSVNPIYHFEFGSNKCLHNSMSWKDNRRSMSKILTPHIVIHLFGSVHALQIILATMPLTALWLG